MTGRNAEQKPGSNSEQDCKTVRKKQSEKKKERQVHTGDQSVRPPSSIASLASVCLMAAGPLLEKAPKGLTSVFQDGSHTQGPGRGALICARPIESCNPQPSRGDDKPCMLGLGIGLKRTEEINLLLSPGLRGFEFSLSSVSPGRWGRCALSMSRPGCHRA